jgi:ribonuclease HIII
MALSDKFGDVRFIERALMEKGRKITLEQRVRAEEDISVASASLVARAEFLQRLKEISKQWTCSLPKGAGPKVEEIAQYLVHKFGPEVLSQVAKVHFRTTQRVLRSEQG